MEGKVPYGLVWIGHGLAHGVLMARIGVGSISETGMSELGIDLEVLRIEFL